MPDWSGLVRTRLAALNLTPTREAEIVEELAQHLAERFDELRRGGVANAEAERLATAELLEPDALARSLRPLRQANVPPSIVPGRPGQSLFGDLGQDVRYAVRMLWRQPGFTAAAVLTLALGLGANSAIFALVDATLLRPLPFPSPERLVMVRERTETASRGRVSPLNLRDWRERSQTLERLAGFVPEVGGMVMSGADGTAETVPRQWVTAGFFDALGVAPSAGRFFLDADDRARARVAVLSEAFWRQRFNADPAVIGREIRLDGQPFTVVGVAPEPVQQLGRTSIWAMRSIEALPPAGRGVYVLHAVGRLKPGVAAGAADADLARIAASLAREYPKTNQGRGVTIDTLDAAVIGGDLRKTSILFLGVVGFVLLICCANVANLLLARATARTRELSIRTALGADRVRVIRQLLTESLLLSAIGGLLGLGVGAGILATAPALIPQGLLPPAMLLSIDLRVVAFCAIAVLLVGLLFGLAPAWLAAGSASSQALAAVGRTSTARGGRLRSVLAAAEVATAVLLLVGAGLLLRTLLAVERVDRGYRADSILTMVVDPLGSRYPTPESMLQFYDEVGREVSAAAGVRSVAWASTLPLGSSQYGHWFYAIEGDPPPASQQQPTADYQIVSPSYFATIDLPIVAGRGFDDRDTRNGTPVCLVNEAIARRHFQGRSPIGRRVALRPTGNESDPPVVREIVGVVRQVRERPDEADELRQVYVPLAQDPVDDIFLVVRPASGPADALAPGVRAAIARIDKEQLVSVRDAMTLADVAWEATGRHRFRAALVTAFAALSLLLAMVGLFGVLAYSVQQRLRDFGIRRALGGSTSDVLRPVVGSALRVTAVGAIAGLALAAALTRWLSTLLFGIEPLDPMTFAAVVFLLALTAVAATAGPALRALRVDPATALRGD